MQLELNDEQAAFQREVREFVSARLPESIKRKVERGLHLAREDYITWQRILNARGWLAPGWPQIYGGTGWDPIRRHLFDEALALGGAPSVVPFGVSMVGPVIIEFGNEAQKARFLPRILSSEDWWCQGYSEPGSGSDLASLSTRAVRDGEHYVVDGTKTWTTWAQHADWMFCLVRTADTGKRQEGISFLLIDMRSTGISVHPIVTMDGGAEINTVHLDGVRVPVENRIGEEHRGWTYAKFLLGHERTNIAAIGQSKAQLARLKRVASAEPGEAGTLITDPDFARQLASLETDIVALEATVLHMVSREQAGQAPGPEASLMKIKGTEIQQRLSELLMRAVGPYAQPFVAEALEDGWNEAPVGPAHAAPLAAEYFNRRKTSIYGGSNEIQKEIIAKAVLGL